MKISHPVCWISPENDGVVGLSGHGTSPPEYNKEDNSGILQLLNLSLLLYRFRNSTFKAPIQTISSTLLECYLDVEARQSVLVRMPVVPG